MPSERTNHVVFRTHMRGDGTKGIEVHTPEKVLPVYHKEELEAQLKHYARFLTNLHTANSVAARRKYVELIRPALRYYCKKFNVDAPSWLASDDYYTKTMSVHERQKQFGMAPLRIGEFQKMKPLAVDGINYPGKDAPQEEEGTDGQANQR
jgi:hypothetical protein